MRGTALRVPGIEPRVPDGNDVHNCGKVCLLVLFVAGPYFSVVSVLLLSVLF